jgi:hypothetical protein
MSGSPAAATRRPVLSMGFRCHNLERLAGYAFIVGKDFACERSRHD